MNIKKLLPGVGVIIFVYLLVKLNVLKIFGEIANINLFFLIISIVLSFLFIFIQTLKWFVIAKEQKVNVPFLKAVKINVISSFYGFITPARVGNVIRADYLKKYSNNSIGKGVGNFILEKFLDLCALVFLVIVASFFSKKIISIGYFLPITMLIIFIAGLLIIMSKKYSRAIFKIIERIIGKLIPKGLREKVKEGFYSFHEDKPKKIFLILFFMINLLVWIMLYLITFFIGLSVGIEVPFFYYLLFLPIATLVAQIPITISGLGTREITLIGLFGLLGVAPTKVFSMAIIGLFLGDIIPGIVGFFLSLKKEK